MTLPDKSASLDINSFAMSKLTWTVFDFLFGSQCLKSVEHSSAFAMSSFVLEILHESIHFHLSHMESRIYSLSLTVVFLRSYLFLISLTTDKLFKHFCQGDNSL